MFDWWCYSGKKFVCLELLLVRLVVGVVLVGGMVAVLMAVVELVARVLLMVGSRSRWYFYF